MQDVPCTLIVDDDKKSLGEVALRLLRLRIDIFYATHTDEAWLLAQQEAERIRAVLFPPSVDFEEITAIATSLRSQFLEIPRSLVVIGERPDEAVRRRLRMGGVVYTRHPNSVEPHHAIGMGVEFAPMTPDVEDRLRRFLNEIAERFAI